jgi:probable HAF family extracellular repeat protein
MPVYIYTTLDDPAATNGTFATGINDQGQIVGTYNDAAGPHGFLYSGGVYTTLDNTVRPLGDTVVNGINALGQIIGYYYDGNGDKHGFLYSNGAYSPLDYPAARQTVPLGISDAGQIVGNYIDSGGVGHGFLYSGGSGGTYTSLNGHLAGANGINTSGQIVGFYFDIRPHGFLYSNGTETTIDYPTATDATLAYGINNHGQIVGTYTDFDDIHGGGGLHSFLYSGGAYTRFDDPLGVISATEGTQAYAINDAGQIVGTYQDSDHHYHGFLLTIAPNPPPPSGTSLRCAIKKLLSHAAIGFSSRRYVAAYPPGRVRRAVSPKQNRRAAVRQPMAG